MMHKEFGSSKQEIKYRKWLDEVGTLLGFYVLEGTDAESDLFDYYSDGADIQDAHDEYRFHNPKLVV